MSDRPKNWPWSVLDLARKPETTAEARRAYARRLKTIDQATDIAGFEALRTAYEAALRRIENKARAEPVPSDDAPVPAAGEPLVEGAAAPDSGPAEQPDAEDPLHALRASLAALGQPSILQSATERVLQLLASEQLQQRLAGPGAQTREYEFTLRQGVAQYLRSQLMSNHLNEPYLRHPGVTEQMLRALDARYGWLSDYSAFRRDFYGDTSLLEAMIDAAGIERHVQVGSVEARTNVLGAHTGWLVPLLGLGFIGVVRQVREASVGAAPDSGIAILSNVLIGAIILGLISLGQFMLYQSVRSNASQRAAIGACIWAGIGVVLLTLSLGLVPGLPEAKAPFYFWGSLTLAGLAALCLWWLVQLVRPLIARLTQNRK